MAIDRDKIRELITGGATAAEINAIVNEEVAKASRESEAAKAPPQFAPMNRADWPAYRDWLLDKGGNNNWAGAYWDARVRAEMDDQEGFILAMGLLFKSCRLALPHLEVPGR